MAAEPFAPRGSLAIRSAKRRTPVRPGHRGGSPWPGFEQQRKIAFARTPKPVSKQYPGVREPPPAQGAQRAPWVPLWGIIEASQVFGVPLDGLLRMGGCIGWGGEAPPQCNAR